MVLMPRVVDPDPFIKARLDALAAEYEPQIEVLASRLGEARRAERWRLQRELRTVKRSYRKAHREVTRLRVVASW